MNQDERFTEEDRIRLSRQKEWIEHPALVEQACLVLHDLDPQGCCSPMNPHAATEYLAEVGHLVQLLPQLDSPLRVEMALDEIFRKMFDGGCCETDWTPVAAALWPDIQQARATLFE